MNMGKELSGLSILTSLAWKKHFAGPVCVYAFGGHHQYVGVKTDHFFIVLNVQNNVSISKSRFNPIRIDFSGRPFTGRGQNDVPNLHRIKRKRIKAKMTNPSTSWNKDFRI
jgi:hypothetical protein